VLITTQVHHQWTQMLQFGKERLSMMAKFMVKKNIKKTLTTFKLMVPSKKTLPMLESLMHQLFSK
jgi:hypothetical protein